MEGSAAAIACRSHLLRLPTSFVRAMTRLIRCVLYSLVAC